MNPVRLIAVGAIFFFTTIAWMILGSTVVARTGESDGRIREEVESLWGREHRQEAPTVAIERTVTRRVVNESVVNGAVTRQVTHEQKRESADSDLDNSTIKASLDLEHRKKGLLWWPTYTVDFQGGYRFSLPPPLATSGDVVDVSEAVVLTIPMSARVSRTSVLSSPRFAGMGSGGRGKRPSVSVLMA